MLDSPRSPSSPLPSASVPRFRSSPSSDASALAPPDLCELGRLFKHSIPQQFSRCQPHTASMHVQGASSATLPSAPISRSPVQKDSVPFPQTRDILQRSPQLSPCRSFALSLHRRRSDRGTASPHIPEQHCLIHARLPSGSRANAANWSPNAPRRQVAMVAQVQPSLAAPPPASATCSRHDPLSKADSASRAVPCRGFRTLPLSNFATPPLPRRPVPNV